MPETVRIPFDRYSFHVKRNAENGVQNIATYLSERQRSARKPHFPIPTATIKIFALPGAETVDLPTAEELQSRLGLSSITHVALSIGLPFKPFPQDYFERLAEIFVLTELKTITTDFDAANAASLAHHIRKNPLLEKLSLKFGDISSSALKSLLESIKDSSSISRLALVGLTHLEMRDMAAIIKDNRHLTSIDLHSNDLEPESFGILLPALRENPRITSLNLSSNNIGVGAHNLAQLLASSNTLTALDISDNKIDAAGMLSLAQAVGINNSLKTLNLSKNRMDDAALVALARSVKTNTSLTDIAFSYSANPYPGNPFSIFRVTQQLTELAEAMFISNEVRHALKIEDKLETRVEGLPLITDERKEELAEEISQIVARKKAQIPDVSFAHPQSAAVVTSHVQQH